MWLEAESKLKKESEFGKMIRKARIVVLVALIVIGITYMLLQICGSVIGGENTMNMPKMMVTRQVEPLDPGAVVEEGFGLIQDWSDTVGEESQDLVAETESKVDDYGKQVADLAGQGFLVTAIIIALAFTIAGFLKSGPSGAAMGAAFGITLGAGVYLIWYNLYHGHVIPVVISFAIAIGSLWQLPKSIAWFIGISAIVVFGFWPLVMPQSWAVVNILNIVDADSWYEFWYMIQGGEFGIFSTTGL